MVTIPNVDGAYLLALRKRIGLTQAQMSGLLGYSSQPNFSDIERGKAPVMPPVQRLAALLAGDTTPKKLIEQARAPK